MLADDTRYGIYRAIAEHPDEDVTVAEVASRFDLHPNVARMHLAKLEQAGFLVTGLRKARGGGRPAKLYRLSAQVVTFGFPPRRYELLSRLALGALAAGASGDEVARLCRREGAHEGRRAVAALARPPRDRVAATELVRRIAEEQGLLPDLVWQDDELHVTVRNCAFREVAGGEPELVCGMHRSFLAGVLTSVMASLGGVHISCGDGRISRGDACCELVCRVSGASARA